MIELQGNLSSYRGRGYRWNILRFSPRELDFHKDMKDGNEI